MYKVKHHKLGLMPSLRYGIMNIRRVKVHVVMFNLPIEYYIFKPLLACLLPLGNGENFSVVDTHWDEEGGQEEQ